MRNGERGNWILILIGAVAVVWLGLLAAPHWEGSLWSLLIHADQIFSRPWSIGFCAASGKMVGICLLAYALGIACYLSSRRNYRRREEHGSAQWGHISAVKRRYSAKTLVANVILTQHIYLSLNVRQHLRNLNVVVVGGSGSGKTRFYAKPNIMNANTSFVCLDPKG